MLIESGKGSYHFKLTESEAEYHVASHSFTEAKQSFLKYIERQIDAELEQIIYDATNKGRF